MTKLDHDLRTNVRGGKATMFCTDPALTLLAKYGYNAVRLPRTGIGPLDVFGMDRNGIEALGRLPAIWESTTVVPAPEDGNVAADIKTVRTSALSASIGVRVLEDILAGLGASVPRVDFAYGHKRTLTFSLGKVSIAKVDPFEVGNYLRAGSLRTGNPWVDRYFFDEETDAFVITEVLMAESVTVASGSSTESKTGVDISALRKALGGSVSVESSNSDESQLTFQAVPARPLTFGFKAFRISYDDGCWKVAGVNPKKGEVFLDAEDALADGLLLVRRADHVGRVRLGRTWA